MLHLVILHICCDWMTLAGPPCAVKLRLKFINYIHSTSSSQRPRPHTKDNRTTATTITTESLRSRLLATTIMDRGNTSNTSNSNNNNSSTAAEAVEAAVVYWTMDTSAL